LNPSNLARSALRPSPLLPPGMSRATLPSQFARSWPPIREAGGGNTSSTGQVTVRRSVPGILVRSFWTPLSSRTSGLPRPVLRGCRVAAIEGEVVSESGCLRTCCFHFPPLGAAELEDRGCDRCSSLTHQFRGLYEGSSPALLRLIVFALRGTQALLLVGDLKNTSDHSLDSGSIPGGSLPWRPLCLVKRTLSTLLRYLLDHQRSPNGISTTSLSQTCNHLPLVDRPTRIVSLISELA
ncbi:hypothetical protein ILYODFUR_035258, partial [Ilyodon furcidens]